MMDDNFAHSDEVAIDNPLGGIRRGADEPHKMYMRGYSRVRRTFTLSFGIIRFIALATYFGPWGGNAAHIMMVKS